MMWVWYLDRGSALAAYTLLWLAAITGVLFNARSFGWLHEAAKKAHVTTSVLASAALLTHVGVGAYDGWLVLTRQVPQPAYTYAYFAAGIVVGVGALLIIVTAVLGFIDAKRFQRPWDPRTVHAFAYAGFAFATLHAVALGTDVVKFALPGVLGASVFLVYVLTLRAMARRIPSGPAVAPVPAGESRPQERSP